MIEIDRLEDVLTEHPELSPSSRRWLSWFALQLMPGFDPAQVHTAEDLADYVSSRDYAPCPRLGAMVLAAINLDGPDKLEKWLAVTDVVAAADQESLRLIAETCGHTLAAYNAPDAGVDASSKAAASLIGFIWHAALEFHDDAESKRLLSEVFAESETPQVD